MSWQLAITLQIIVSSFMTLFTRHLTLSLKRVFFSVGVFSYIMIAIMGSVYSLGAQHSIPGVPSGDIWPYLFIEGVCIPAAWLTQYKLIGMIGAGNAVVAYTLYTASAALFGVVLLRDTLTLPFVLGTFLVLTSALISLRIDPDTIHHTTNRLNTKIVLALSGATLFGIGMFAEKVAVNSIGVWDYTMYGWAMQAVGALSLFVVFGRKEFPHISRVVTTKGLLLGLITSIAGGLYVYALSKGSLSHTIIAASGRIAITVLLAAILFRERNALPVRIAAFALAVIGLWLIVY